MVILLKTASVRLVSFKSCKLESKTRAKVFGKVDMMETYHQYPELCICRPLEESLLTEEHMA